MSSVSGLALIFHAVFGTIDAPLVPYVVVHI